MSFAERSPLILVRLVDERGEFIANNQDFFAKFTTEVKLKDSMKTKLLQSKVKEDHFLVVKLVAIITKSEERDDEVYNLKDEYREFQALKLLQRMLKTQTKVEQEVMPLILTKEKNKQFIRVLLRNCKLCNWQTREHLLIRWFEA